MKEIVRWEDVLGEELNDLPDGIGGGQGPFRGTLEFHQPCGGIESDLILLNGLIDFIEGVHVNWFSLCGLQREFGEQMKCPQGLANLHSIVLMLIQLGDNAMMLNVEDVTFRGKEDCAGDCCC